MGGPEQLERTTGQVVADGERAANDTPPARLKELLRPFPAEGMGAYPVSKYVSKVGNEGPQCIEPLAAEVAS